MAKSSHADEKMPNVRADLAEALAESDAVGALDFLLALLDSHHLKPEGRLHFFVAGTGGKLRTIQPGPRSLFAKGAHGFAVLEADAAALTITFVETDLSSP